MSAAQQDLRVEAPVASGPFPARIAALLGVLGWTALVHSRVPGFFLIASAFCAGWVLASLVALGPGLRAGLRFRPADVALGAGLAAVLFVGARLVLWAMCLGHTEALCGRIDEVYGAFGKGTWPSALALMFLIAPGEEFFWRGVVQGWLRPRWGAPTALVVTSVLSSLALLAFGEPLLALAALPTSLGWGLLVEWRKSLWPALISHALWDLLIFVLFPV